MSQKCDEEKTKKARFLDEAVCGGIVCLEICLNLLEQIFH